MKNINMLIAMATLCLAFFAFAATPVVAEVQQPGFVLMVESPDVDSHSDLLTKRIALGVTGEYTLANFHGYLYRREHYPALVAAFADRINEVQLVQMTSQEWNYLQSDLQLENGRWESFGSLPEPGVSS